MPRWVALLLLVSAAAAGETVRATRTAVPPVIDGAIDDHAWAAAEPFSNFVESWPKEGAAPTQKTEVRVLYDDSTLYVGVVCFDTEPQAILRTLGRRDSTPTADLIEVGIDSTLSRRTAYYFAVNAGGVQRDALLFNDVSFSETWDAVWSAAVAPRPDGWSVELAIPLSILRFPKAGAEQRWGFLVRRQIPRTHQVFDSTLISRTTNASVSRFGELVGLTDLKPKRGLEVVPYAAARLIARPQYSPSTTPTPRLVDPSLDVGADLRTSLFSDLTLNATVNPDFGQVEADQLILNLSNGELFFPEKRPFFNQGLDLFQPIGSEYGAPHQLFYSRRIGLDTPIFAAAKVSGTLGAGFSLGVLDAVVLGAADPGKRPLAYRDATDEEVRANEASPSRQVGFHPERALHLGLDDELPAERPVPKNFLAAVGRYDASSRLGLGATFTSATPLAPRCRESDFATREEYEAADCLALGGEALALDWDLRSEDHNWVFLGVVDGSHREGGPREDVLRDGTVMHPGDLGYGGYFKAGKFGGEGFRFRLDGSYASPRLDLNATGFLPSQNQARLGALVQYLRNKGLDRLQELYAHVAVTTFWSTDGRFTPRGTYFNTEFNVTLPSFDTVGCSFSVDVPFYDVREIDGAGVPFERPPSSALAAYFFGDGTRPLVFSLVLYGYRTFPSAVVPPGLGFGGDGTILVRPHPRLETRLDVHAAHDPNGARYVDDLGDSAYLFGQQDAENFSATLRQTLVLSPTLTLQAYAQLYSAFAHYPAYYRGQASAGERLHVAALQSTRPGSSYDFHDAALNLNVVLRWEYRLGSTLFLVYSRSQRELGYFDDQPPTTTLFPLRLGPGPTTDTVLLKWSWWLSA